jgi:hypothetical protein
MSSKPSSKSKTAKFSAILSLRTDLGITTTPRCRSQRQHDLGHRSALVLRDGQKDRVLEEAVLALGELAPGLVLYAELPHDLGGCDLLAEGMRLNLVHGRGHLVVEGQVDQSVGRKVADAANHRQHCSR